MNFSWTEVHGAFTHFPVGFIIAALAFEIGALVFSKPEWRVVSFWCLVVGLIGAVASLIVGNMAGHEVTASPGGPSLATLALHRSAAYASAAFAAAALLVRIFSHDRTTFPVMAAGLVLLIAATASVGYAGYLGGVMVFGDDIAAQSGPGAAH